MIIISTNRNVFPSKLGVDIFGNSFGGVGNRYATARFVEGEVEYVDWDEDEELHEPEDRWEIDLVPIGQEADFFQNLCAKINSGDDEASRPWVCFLHGNNQSFAKNLRKCKRIEDLYNVNVYAFSWPSMPRTYTRSLYDVMKGFISPLDAIKLIKSRNMNVLDISSNNIVTGLIKNKLDDYKIARSRAKDSANAYLSALQCFHDHFVSQIGTALDVSLLVHSLGNHVIESLDADEYQTKLPAFFTNVIFHQADVDADQYDNWLPDISSALASHAFITINEHDWVLFLSMLANKKHRLGMVSYDHSLTNVTYVDFTDGAGVSSNHTLFTSKATAFPEIHGLFKRLLSSETDIPLTQIGYELTPESLLFRLVDREEIDIWGDSPDDD